MRDSIGLSIGYHAEISTNAGISLGDCDNNCIIRPWIYPLLLNDTVISPGVCVEKASGTQTARANYFYHLQPAGDTSTANPPLNVAFWIKQANPNSPGNKNLVFGYDQENGQGQPRAWNNGTELSSTDVKKFLFWIDLSGTIHGYTSDP